MPRPTRILLRGAGLLILPVIIWRLDGAGLLSALGDVNWLPIAIAIAMTIPQVGLKAIRWWVLLRKLSLHHPITTAVVDYFASLLAGLLTPGRLGELVRAWSVERTTHQETGLALASVVADRLFDLYMLFALGLVGLSAITSVVRIGRPFLVASALGLTLLLLAFLSDRTFQLAQKVHWPGRRWIEALRAGLRSLTPKVILGAVALTLGATTVFAIQCTLVARAAGISLTFLNATSAVALGSLVALIPVSISGIGTRDAVIVAFLTALDVPPESALTFSLLVFATFFIAGGALGAVAWMIRPISLAAIRQSRAPE